MCTRIPPGSPDSVDWLCHWIQTTEAQPPSCHPKKLHPPQEPGWQLAGQQSTTPGFLCCDWWTAPGQARLLYSVRLIGVENRVVTWLEERCCLMFKHQRTTIWISISDLFFFIVSQQAMCLCCFEFLCWPLEPRCCPFEAISVLLLSFYFFVIILG